MQDKLDRYYYPIPQNKRIRMYVRPNMEDIDFRMWDADDPTLWEEHGWAPWSAIQQAAELYRSEGRKGGPPLHLYDTEVAKRLIRDSVSD